MLDPNKKYRIDTAITDIENRLVNLEMDSWDCVIALAETLICICPLKADESNKKETEIYVFEKHVRREQKNNKEKDSHKEFDIQDLMKPDSEVTVQGIARLGIYNSLRKKAYEEWAKEKPRKESYNSDFVEAGEPGLIKKEDAAIYNGEPLCDTMHIAPSGTGLIKTDMNTDGMHDFYGVSMARITTYSLSLKAIDTDKTKMLMEIIQNALTILKKIPRPYHGLFDGGMGGSIFDNYSRPFPYPKEKDGMITITDRIDLDDLWIFYYMIEPALEPNAQIAVAVDGARYAEERGAPLSPDTLYIENQEHEVDDKAHILANNENVLPIALRDAFHDVAIGRINKGQFISRLSVLADHSLQGTITDPNQLLLTYDKMITDQSSENVVNKGELITYQDAMTSRVYDFIRVLTGCYEDDDTPLPLALMQMINKYGPQLKEQAKQDSIDKEAGNWERIEESSKRWSERTKNWMNNQGKSLNEVGDSLLSEETDDFSIDNLSDAFDRLRGKENKDTNNRLVEDKPTQLVIRDSEVETCLDDMYCLGSTWDRESGKKIENYYRSKTKNSMLPRYKLPTKLKPFTRNHDPRKGVNILTFNPLK